MRPKQGHSSAFRQIEERLDILQAENEELIRNTAKLTQEIEANAERKRAKLAKQREIEEQVKVLEAQKGFSGSSLEEMRDGYEAKFVPFVQHLETYLFKVKEAYLGEKLVHESFADVDQRAAQLKRKQALFATRDLVEKETQTDAQEEEEEEEDTSDDEDDADILISKYERQVFKLASNSNVVLFNSRDEIELKQEETCVNDCNEEMEQDMDATNGVIDETSDQIDDKVETHVKETYVKEARGEDGLEPNGEDLIENGNNEGTKSTEETSEALEDRDGDEDGKRRCKGCGEEFSFNGGTAEDPIPYITQCSNGCEVYKKLGFVEKCDECHKLFIDSDILDRHLKEEHPEKLPRDRFLWTGDEEITIASLLGDPSLAEDAIDVVLQLNGDVGNSSIERLVLREDEFRNESLLAANGDELEDNGTQGSSAKGDNGSVTEEEKERKTEDEETREEQEEQVMEKQGEKEKEPKQVSEKTPTKNISSAELFIPRTSIITKMFASRILCKGCNTSFPCHRKMNDSVFQKIPHPDYYKHCVKDCKAYQEMGEIRECFDCNFQFLDESGFVEHNGRYHRTEKASSRGQKRVSNTPDMASGRKKSKSSEPGSKATPVGRETTAEKPKWLPEALFSKTQSVKDFGDTMLCLGCRQPFTCHKNGKNIIPCLEYYAHCVVCDKYQALNLIHECYKCETKFFSKHSFVTHKRKCQQNSVLSEGGEGSGSSKN